MPAPAIWMRRCPDDMYALMRRCWEYEAPLRPTFPDLCAILSGQKTIDVLGTGYGTESMYP
jgi:hypothetical protein